jgi:hypothetical protein
MKKFAADTLIQDMKLKAGEIVEIAGRQYKFAGTHAERHTKFGVDEVKLSDAVKSKDPNVKIYDTLEPV